MTSTAPLSRPSRARSLSAGIAAAAIGIAVVTVASRLVGFGRTVTFARTVGPTCLGDTYVTANTVPNIIFEVVAGGALASMVVPVLAAAAARGDRAEVGRTTSALLTWTMAALIPLMLIGMALTRPMMSLLVGGAREGCDRAAEIEVGARMLLVFLPQIVFYGICIVLTGVLQAHRRFFGPALAPLLSSVVVIACYLAFAAQVRVGERSELATVGRAAELTLSIGTTLGVVVLALSLLVPLRRLGLPLRPRFDFPPGVGRRVGRLAVAGLAALAAQQLSVAVVLRLAHEGSGGTLVLYNLAWTVFLLPWAVLAVPLATSAFPALAEHAGNDEARYATTAAATTRGLLVLTFGACAVMVATATPVARMLVLHVPGNGDTPALAWTLVAFAPGLLGYALIAHLGRALYARGSGRFPAAAIVIGWVVVIVADVIGVAVTEPRWRVVALGVGNSIGMTVAGLLLLAGLHRVTRGAGLVGVLGTGGSALAGAGAAGAVGWYVAGFAGALGPAASLGAAVGIALFTMAVFIAVTVVFSPPVLRLDLLGLLAGSRVTSTDSDLAARGVVLVLGTSTGGVGRHVASVARGLVESGRDVTVLGPAATEELFTFTETGAAFRPVEIAPGLRPVADLRAALHLRVLLDGARKTASGPDVVHAHGLRAGLLCTLALGNRRDIPLVVTWHNVVLAAGLRGRFLAEMERKVARGADVTLCVSSDLLKRVRQLGGRDVRLSPVAAPHLSSPSRDPAATRDALGLAEGQRLIVTAARLHAQKGLDVLVDAMALLAGRPDAPVAVVAGVGPLKEQLERQIATTGSPVHLLGARDDVAELLEAADLAVLPSRWEGSPLFVQEVLRAGRTLVATAVGGTPDLVGDAAILVAPDDPLALAEAIAALLDDPEAATELAQRGLCRAAGWADDRDVVLDLMRLYGQLAKVPR